MLASHWMSGLRQSLVLRVVPILHFFNESYARGTDIRDTPMTSVIHAVPKAISDTGSEEIVELYNNGYLREVIEFLVNGNAREKLGVTLESLMNTDYTTFLYIKKLYNTYHELHHAEQAKALAVGVKNAARNQI